MDESFSVCGSKFPEGEPNDEWDVQEVLRWSLDQYHKKGVEQTSQSIVSLRNQCEKECEDVMTLHSLAVDMASKSNAEGGRDEENVDPQSENTEGGENVVSKPSAAANLPAGTKPASSTIEIEMIVGPHSSTKYLLCPRPGQPCLLGRSKGKKFIKNGVSLHKDQEVSTTHGKFVVEGGGLRLPGGESGEAGGEPRFYFIDLASTNGSVYSGDQLEPHEPLLLEDGMELKVGNSVLRVALG